MIADCEMKMNRPVASRAALRLVVACLPDNTDAREQFEALFGDKSHLPLAARREYPFLRPNTAASGQRRAAWDQALAGLNQARLADAVRVFDELTRADPQDASAWYNLALARAWLGDNAPALEALDHYAALEPDETRAAEAWALGEVLRLGYGLEEVSDHLEYSVTYLMRDARYVVSVLQEWEKGHRLLPMQSNREEQIFTALVLDSGPVITATPGLIEAASMGAYLMTRGNLLRLWGPLSEPLGRIRGELETRASAGLSQGQTHVRNAGLNDVLSEALVFPMGVTDPTEAGNRVRRRAEQFFEETWPQRPLLSLGSTCPRDAVGDPILRKKLRGVVLFLQQSAVGGALESYDFDRLRRHLGLLNGQAAPAAPVLDIAAMSVPQLSALQSETLTDEQLEQAFQTAQRLEAGELGILFARALISRPVRPDHPDRYSWYYYLVQQALREGNTEAALQHLGEGEKADIEHNEGRRRNDFDLRRGQVHARRGEADAAQEVFDRLIQRDPSNLHSHSAAAEAMLSLRQGTRALRFAEEGLVQARQQNNRDSENHLMELAGAARKLA